MSEQDSSKSEGVTVPQDPLEIPKMEVSPLGQERNGYDELNLAEFPVAGLSDRINEDSGCVVFTDKIWDVSQKKTITRTLKISPSAAYGLPTALDDELLLGLMQMTKDHFSGELPEEPVDVPFSRYGLLRTLGWKHNGDNYKRVEESINRWAGVTLYYDNAWWDKEKMAWAKETFHFIDNATFFEQRAEKSPQQSLFCSSFRWNRVIWRSFRSRNMKGLDFERYKKLESSIAKRLYRFLDKRFYQRRSWTFDLAEISYEHIGLSRTYDQSNLKRKLTPAILELERECFLAPKSTEQRFRKIKAGVWHVFFDAYEKDVGGQNAAPKPVTEGPTLPKSAAPAALYETLVGYGVSQSTAEELLKAYTPEKIAMQIEVFDWKKSQNEKSIAQNPPGYLVSAIRGDYAKPPGFVSKKSAEELEKAKAQKELKRLEKLAAKEREAKRLEQEKNEMVANFWDAMTPEYRATSEKEAMAGASGMERDVIERAGPMAGAVRKSILEKYALKILSIG